MIYKINFNAPNNKHYEFYAKTYKQIADKINSDVFGGFNILKTTTIKASYKKTAKRNHILTYIPSFNLERITEDKFENKSEYDKFKLSIRSTKMI